MKDGKTMMSNDAVRVNFGGDSKADFDLKNAKAAGGVSDEERKKNAEEKAKAEAKAKADAEAKAKAAAAPKPAAPAPNPAPVAQPALTK